MGKPVQERRESLRERHLDPGPGEAGPECPKARRRHHHIPGPVGGTDQDALGVRHVLHLRGVGMDGACHIGEGGRGLPGRAGIRVPGGSGWNPLPTGVSVSTRTP